MLRGKSLTTSFWFICRNWLISKPSSAKIIAVVAVDFLILGTTLVLLLPFIKASWLPILPLVPITGLIFAIGFKLYRNPSRILTRNILFGAAGSQLPAAILLAASQYSLQHPFAAFSLAVSYWCIATIGMVASRQMVRMAIHPDHDRRNINRQRRTIIYGADREAIGVIERLRAQGNNLPIALVDDDPSLVGREICGLHVYPLSELKTLVDTVQADEVMMAKRAMTPRQRIEIEKCISQKQVHVSFLPSAEDVAHGRVQISPTRKISIENLLGRDIVAPNLDLMRQAITGKSILVTGAGGSIGSELVRAIVKHRPKMLVLLEMHELALFEIGREIDRLSQEIDHMPPVQKVLGSVLDDKLLRRIMQEHAVDVVYHAAAYKHVGLVEDNPSKGIETNVFGTLNVARCAIECNVAQFIQVSTDKAVRPPNVMGASKRLAEMVLQALEQADTRTRFSMVRFGNVLGSSGSVVPLFREQIEKGGPVTVTHQEVYRYFMMIPEAAQLVVQAAAMAEGGEVFLLDMGEPVKIFDLAARMITLAGLTLISDENPDGDIEIVITGLKPGEKLFEELLIGNNAKTSKHPQISTSRETFMPWEKLSAELEFLEQVMASHPMTSVRARLLDLANNRPVLPPQQWLRSLKVPEPSDWLNHTPQAHARPIQISPSTGDALLAGAL